MAEQLTPQNASGWQQWLANFNATAARFVSTLSTLQQLGPYIQQHHPELLSQYNSLVASGQQNQSKLQSLQSVASQVESGLQTIIADVSSFTGQAAGAVANAAGQAAGYVANTAESAWDSVKKLFGFSGFAGFGIAPIIIGIGLVAAVALLAAIASWINDAVKFQQRVAALQAQEAKGATPAQASQIVNQLVGGPGVSLFGVSIPWQWIAIGVGALVVLPLLAGRRR